MRLGGWCDGELPAEHLSKSWLELAGAGGVSVGGWRNREEKLGAGHDAAAAETRAAVQRSRENNIQTEYFCLSPFCLQDLLSLEFRSFDIDILAFTP